MLDQNKKYDYKVLIKEFHLDSYGHVNNATYVQLYEEARWEFLTENDYGFKRIHSSKQGPVVLEMNVKYRKELGNREWITIRSFDFSVKGKILKMKQQMLKKDGEIASEADLTFGFMDLEKRKLMLPPKEWLAQFGLE